MSAPKSPWGDNNDKQPKKPISKPTPIHGSGGGNRPPRRPQNNRNDNIEDFFKNGQDRFRQQFGDGGDGKIVILLVAIGLVIWLISGFYRVESDEVGVELTFGEWTNEAEPSQPGLHYHWPSPIGQVITPTVTRENRTPVGFTNSQDSGSRSPNTRTDVPSESLMLTGDENIVDIDFNVFWRIKDAGKYLFSVQNPVTTVKITSESVMREIIGRRTFNSVLTVSKEEIATEVTDRIQEVLDSYDLGVRINKLELLDVRPPSKVIDAFDEVQRAIADKKRLQEEAKAYANEIIPKAKGEVAQIIKDAEGYKQQVVSKATGDAERFISVYDAYAPAKQVTKDRLYLETMENVLNNANKIIIDSKAGSGVVPYLPLNELKKGQ